MQMRLETCMLLASSFYCLLSLLCMAWRHGADVPLLAPRDRLRAVDARTSKAHDVTITTVIFQRSPMLPPHSPSKQQASSKQEEQGDDGEPTTAVGHSPTAARTSCTFNASPETSATGTAAAATTASRRVSASAADTTASRRVSVSAAAAAATTPRCRSFPPAHYCQRSRTSSFSSVRHSSTSSSFQEVFD